MAEETFHSKHGEGLVVFGGDGHFHPVTENEDGTHEPEWDVRLHSQDGEWHYSPFGHPPHNQVHESNLVGVEIE